MDYTELVPRPRGLLPKGEDHKVESLLTRPSSLAFAEGCVCSIWLRRFLSSFEFLLFKSPSGTFRVGLHP